MWRLTAEADQGVLMRGDSCGEAGGSYSEAAAIESSGGPQWVDEVAKVERNRSSGEVVAEQRLIVERSSSRIVSEASYGERSGGGDWPQWRLKRLPAKRAA